MDRLYKMELHELITPAGDPSLQILRVPGGWIYHTWHDDSGRVGEHRYTTTSVFVPFNNEFQK